MNFKDEMKQKVAQIEIILDEYLPAQEGLQKTVLTAMNTTVKAGGKRLRPMLINETYQMFGGKGDIVKPFMAAIEMIHTYSLIHDDLPALDNDDYRRGQKTCHIVYGEDMAILAGDALLNYAYETMLQAFSLTEDQDRVICALKVMAEKTGIHGMLGGQSVDVENDGKPLEKEMLDYIYRNKTSALIEASMMTGAILAGADEQQVAVVEEAAGNIGLAFQIQDDILDVTSTDEELGKPVHSDEKNNKVTYVTLFGVQKASEQVRELSEKAPGSGQKASPQRAPGGHGRRHAGAGIHHPSGAAVQCRRVCPLPDLRRGQRPEGSPRGRAANGKRKAGHSGFAEDVSPLFAGAERRRACGPDDRCGQDRRYSASQPAGGPDRHGAGGYPAGPCLSQRQADHHLGPGRCLLPPGRIRHEGG